MKYLLPILCLFMFSCDSDDAHIHSGVCAGAIYHNNSFTESIVCWLGITSQVQCSEKEAQQEMFNGEDTISLDWYLDMTCEDFCNFVADINEEEECNLLGD